MKIRDGCCFLDQVSLALDGGLHSCCRTMNIKFKTFEELRAWQSEQTEKFKNNLWPDACKSCKNSEALTGKSTRTNGYYNGYNINDPNPKIKYLELSYSNLCNYSCIMCDQTFSSSIYDLAIKLDKKPIHWQINNKKFNNSNISHFDTFLKLAPDIKKVTLIGGEPFLIKEYLTLIKKMSPDACLLIISNASVYNKDFINECKRFNNVSIMFSIDGYGIVNEALRLNSKWKTIEKNILRIKNELPNGNVGLCPAWTNFSIYHWSSLYKWAIKHGLYDADTFWTNTVDYPAHLKMCHMSSDWKNYIKQSFAGTKFKIINYLDEETTETDESLVQQYNIVKHVGATKGFDYETLFPHIYKDFNNFQQN